MPTHTQSQSAIRQGARGPGKPGEGSHPRREAEHRAEAAADRAQELGPVVAPSEEPVGGEADGRHRGLEVGGGVPLNTPLEDGQMRGVDAEDRPAAGIHGGPGRTEVVEAEGAAGATDEDGLPVPSDTPQPAASRVEPLTATVGEEVRAAARRALSRCAPGGCPPARKPC
jgi:hypothetical protein